MSIILSDSGLLTLWYALVNKELETIIQERNFKMENTSLWESIRLEVPTLLFKIISEDYKQPIATPIKDPLDSSRKETLETFMNRLTQHLSHSFNLHPPFTIVRLSELLHSPKQHYNTAEKFLRALENVIQVSSSIAEFPETTFETNENDDHSPNKVEYNENTLPVSIGTDDTETIYLTKISWLTEEDIKEVESEHYLVDEYPLNDAPLNEEYDHNEEPIENEQKKRALDEPKESPEKKHKASEESSERTVVRQEESVEQKEGEKEEVRERGETDEEKEDLNKEETDEVDKEEQNVSLIEADGTLDEDKMEFNTTLEEDKMDLD